MTWRRCFRNCAKRSKSSVYSLVEAADDTLVRRFETTRRRHPLSENKTILGGLALERELLSPIRNADIVIDTTGLKSNEFRTKLLDIMG